MTNKPQMIQAEHYQEDIEEEGRVVDTDINALAQLNSAEINQQIMTAHAYPRSLNRFRKEMRELVTLDEPTALSCLYALQRGNKAIEGPSIRFAEAALQAWGNARAGARVIDIGDQFITAQGFFYDLEKNVAIAFEVMRRITDRNGNRYGEDMIGVTGNAACSIALRNAILRGVPKTAWNEPYQTARHLSVGKGESISVKRESMLKAFAAIGVQKEKIFGYLGIPGVEDVSVDHMILMAGVLNAIKEGETTAEREFAPENMKDPNVATPPRPTRGGFERPKADEQKVADQPKDENKAQGETAVQQKEDAPKETTATSQPSDDAMAGFLAEMIEELKTKKTVKEIVGTSQESPVSFRDRVTENLEEPEASQWIQACDDQMAAIKAAFKGGKK